MNHLKDYLNESVYKYLEKISEPTPIPSGGATFGLTGALSSSLAEMIANISALNQNLKDFKSINESLSELFSYATTAFEKIILQDIAAYWMLRADIQNKDIDKEIQKKNIEESLMRACEPSMTLIEISSKLAEALNELSTTASKFLLSDIGVSACLLEATVKSGWLTLLVNFNSIEKPKKFFIDEVILTKERKNKTLVKLNEIFNKIENNLSNDI